MSKMVYRKQLGINLPNEMADWLKEYSKETGIPMSRVAEKAMKDYRVKLESSNKK